MRNSAILDPSAETAGIQRANDDPAVMAKEILRILSIYDGAGIASRERVQDAPAEFHPQNAMPDLQSIIVLAREPRDVSKENIVGKFHHAIGMIAAQDAVIQYLKRKGYKSQIIGSRATYVSLPRLGERAGVGELSPFGTLVVKGHALRTVLSAIVTDAPLKSSPLVSGVCVNKAACLKRCAALDADGTFDRKKCKSCGACVNKCTVE